MLKSSPFIPAILFILFLSLTSCHVAQKMDAYIAGQFNNKLPKPDKRNDSSFSVTSSLPSDPGIISVTEKTSKSLVPLIVYWKYDYRLTSTLNPAIGVNYFRKTIYQQASRLKQKLNGQQLELSVEQLPGSFAIVDRGHILLLFIHWHKLYVEADSKDLIVLYRLVQNGKETKSGKIVVPNIQKNKGVRFAQSWKSCTSEFLAQYSIDMTEMTKIVVNNLIQQLQ
jgi:hypothetical protein